MANAVKKYEEKEVESLVDGYAKALDKAEFISEFAGFSGRTIASVRQKLVQLGVYQKPQKVQKTAKNGDIIRKGDLVKQIAELAGETSPELFDSLEKSTKYVLESLLKALSK